MLKLYAFFETGLSPWGRSHTGRMPDSQLVQPIPQAGAWTATTGVGRWETTSSCILPERRTNAAVILATGGRAKSMPKSNRLWEG